MEDKPMKKFLLIIQIVSALVLLFSKYLLAIENIWGWWIAVGAYALIAFYNAKANLKIYALVGVSLALLTLYGGIKWNINIPGLGIFDYLVVAGTVVAAIYMATEAFKAKEDSLWLFETIGTMVFMASFLILGWGHVEGWFGFLIGHTINMRIYFKKKAYWFFGIQIISVLIALAKILELPIPILS